MHTSTSAFYVTFLNIRLISWDHLISFPYYALVTGKQVLVY